MVISSRVILTGGGLIVQPTTKGVDETEEDKRVDDNTFRCIRFPDNCSPVSVG